MPCSFTAVAIQTSYLERNRSLIRVFFTGGSLKNPPSIPRIILMTSSFIAEIDESQCRGCGQCAKACPINAISLEKTAQPNEVGRERPLAGVNRSICLGCGVCSLKCEHGALYLKKRRQRVQHPENVFEFKILACLERGTIQNQIFDDPQAITHKVP